MSKESKILLKEQRIKNKKMRKQSLIINSAEEVFVEYGFDNSFIGQIALNAGYTKASIYNYYSSKDDLFTAVLANIYEIMHNEIASYLQGLKDLKGLHSVGEGYLSFMRKYPGKASLIDSGRCVTINRVIIEKEELGEQLTESEHQFRQNEERLGEFIAGIIAETMIGNQEIDKTILPKIGKILSAFMPVIREIVARGDRAGQSEEEIRGTLAILFNMLEKGVKYYDK